MNLEQDFKDALASWASGVSIVAANAPGGDSYGLTVSAFNSVSLDPPLVMVCLSCSNRLPALIREDGRFSVSILASGQEEVSNHFARSGREPGPGLDGFGADQGDRPPVVAGAASSLQCEVHDTMDEGDHTIVVGRVVEAHSDEVVPVLVYHRRGYHGVGD